MLEARDFNSTMIEFKNPLEGFYKNEEEKTLSNLLVIQRNPNESISLRLNMKNILNDNRVEPVSMGFSVDSKEIPEAYELLIFDALRGNSTFFSRWKEVELPWKWVQPILEAFEENILPLHPYPSGSMGSEASH
ncbi:Glucose-6-phosphate dehydrogenase, C-terminal domain [Aneurinibacillus migulanus]|uniref:Glucose-6-phosphate dehydrogenase, C-terminal domain n=2 Tax=Aneurinibacillus migulanus TaxID=47500 RepID=A0A1G9ACP6_ANEMI|nr:hypothetical protein AMI01nite_39850 [Aneurinibacillus migulanus]SDK25162.1 Glucose-6-phosphate dehydrogenase, C-terminal domain [Aneurinibacillus migulanus]